jgi:peroxiredoxin
MDTYYSFLGIKPGASQSEIDTAYQQQRERYNVERLSGMDEEIQRTAAERTAELERIYAILSDSQKRQQYDQSIGLQETADQQPAASNARASRPALSARERWYAVGGVLVALVLVAIIWVVTDQDERPSVGEVNRPAPQLTLPTLDGGELQLQQYRGSVVLVNFWGTWCEPCKRETPALQTAYEQLQDQGLMVVGINLADNEIAQGNSESDIRAFVDQYHVTYPIALDFEGEARTAFQIYPIPTSYFIDPQGNIRYVRIGEITTEEVTTLFWELQQETMGARK